VNLAGFLDVRSGTSLAQRSSVSAPRQILAGTTYLVTRRCSERRFFLRPSKAVNEIFLYVLAVAAERYGVLVHAACVLSNHVHMIVTDPHARLPEFHRYLDGLVARAVNCSLGRWESFWDPDSYSAVRLGGESDILDKLVYVLANPVAAGLVGRAHEWPGVWTDPAAIGGAPIVVARPKEFFREGGPLPHHARLVLHRPPGFEDSAEFIRSVTELLTAAEDRAATEREREGRSVLGARRVLAQKPFARPAPGEPRRTLKPQVACRNKWRRIEMLLRTREFPRLHREALDVWKAGIRSVLFPAGTWAMRVFHGVSCAPA
jgi:REP-associated tyrosine transposase